MVLLHLQDTTPVSSHYFNDIYYVRYSAYSSLKIVAWLK